MLGHQVGVHFNIGEFVSVSLEVDFQIAFGGESISADITLVRPFSCVGPDMDLQSRIWPKDFSAVATSMFEKWLTLFVKSAGVFADTEIC